MKHIATSVLLLAAFGMNCLLFAETPEPLHSTTPAETNLVRGKRLHFEQPATYRLTHDPRDEYDLTDGNYRDFDVWIYRDSCGWYASPYISIIMELGETPQPVSNVRVHMSMGHGGVRYPDQMHVLAGNEPDAFVPICDIIEINRDMIPPYSAGRCHHWLESKGGHGEFKARYLKLLVFPSKEGNNFFMVDELEVIAGSPKACPIDTKLAFRGSTAEQVMRMRLEKRLEQDVAQLEANARLAGHARDFSMLADRLRQDEAMLTPLRQDTDFPINPAQRELAKANQTLMAEAGLKGLVAWTSNRWNCFNSFSFPQDDANCLLLKCSAGETRNLAVNFTNAEADEQTLRFKVSSPFPVKVSRGYAAADPNNFFNSNRLEPVQPEADLYEALLLPGESVQYFLRVEIPAGTQAGEYALEVRPETGGGKQFDIAVGHLKFPSELSTEYGTWDYLNRLGCHGQVIDQGNLAAAMALIRQYQMNVTWGHEFAVPHVTPDMFDAEGALVQPMDFAAFDAWVKSMPGFRRYALFGGAGLKSYINTGFDPLKDREAFMRRMTSYAASLATHVENDLGLNPESFLLHFIDEASTPEGKKILSAWCASIAEARTASGKKMASYGNPSFSADKELYAYPEIDILQPQTGQRREMAERLMQVSAKRGDDTRFGLYSCEGDARMLDPYLYYGGNFRVGFLFDHFLGASFWNLATAPCDISEYEYNGRCFSPWYFRGSQIFVSRQYEGIWEGRCDYEYLLLLKRVDKELTAIQSPLATQSATLCEDIRHDLLDELTPPNVPRSQWRGFWTCDKRRDIADLHRNRIWTLMEEVALQHPDILAKLGWF